MAGVKTRLNDYAVFDEVVVQRLVDGHRVGRPISAPEAAEATRRLAHLGFTDGQIAHRLGFTRRSVVRIRARLGIPAAVTPVDNQHSRRHDAPTRPRMEG